MHQPNTFAERVERRMLDTDSLVCIGLDPVLERLPGHFERSVDSVVHLCQATIEATHPYAAAFKPNLGFFTALGRPGLNALWAVRHSIPSSVPVILDCKVGDVSETARAYAHGWFNEFGFDALTVSPYLGEDAAAPFLEYEDKGVIVLCKTSNSGSGDLQDLPLATGDPLFLTVADKCREWNARYPASVGLVVGATYPEQLASVRRRVGDQLILLPGLGAQGGQLEASVTAGVNAAGTGMLCSSSRAIMYASEGQDFDVAAQRAAQAMRDQINEARARVTVND
ncbi:MAG: orotidine-5'-phosphate decarboxylase [Chloroflexia bacterium]|nr:orotidine-5'-phosphate decarboxylase [Chloroflexia bacterium]